MCQTAAYKYQTKSNQNDHNSQFSPTHIKTKKREIMEKLKQKTVEQYRIREGHIWLMSDG